MRTKKNKFKTKKYIIVNFLEGKSRIEIKPYDCYLIGNLISDLQNKSRNCNLNRKNSLSLKGCNKIFKRAIQRCGTKTPTDDALIVAVYNERAADNGRKYFGSSNNNIRQSVVKRFNNEKLDALKSLELELKASTQAQQGSTPGAVTLPVGPQ